MAIKEKRAKAVGQSPTSHLPETQRRQHRTRAGSPVARGKAARDSVRGTAAAVEKAPGRRDQKRKATGEARLEQERKVVDAVSAIGRLEL